VTNFWQNNSQDLFAFTVYSAVLKYKSGYRKLRISPSCILTKFSEVLMKTKVIKIVKTDEKFVAANNKKSM